MVRQLTREQLQKLRACCKDEESFATMLRVLAEGDSEAIDNRLRETTEMLRVEIEERQRAQDALHYSETNLRAILDNTPLAFVLIGEDHKVITANRLAIEHAKSIFGRNLNSGVSIYEFVLDRDLDNFNHNFQQALKGQQVTTELDFRVKLGTTLYFRFIYQPVVSEDGHLFGVCIIAEDITRRKQVELALRESEARLRSITSHYPNGAILVYDHDLRYVLVDGMGLEQAYLHKDELIGKTIYEVLDVETLKTVEPIYKASLRGEKSTIEASFKEHIYLLHATPILDEDGNIIAGMTITQDITTHKIAEQSKVDLKLEKERIRILTDFIRDASHEFRTPLATIKSGLHLVTNQSLTPPQKEHVRIMEEQVERILNLVDALVKMSFLDNPQSLKFEAVDMNDAVAIAADVATKNYATTLHRKLDNSIPRVQGNLDELIRGMKNILDNALRYTPDDGSVYVRSYWHEGDVVVEVEDTGIGIEEEYLPHIFKRFFRVDSAHSTAGLGLGLSMTRKIIERHDGTIEVLSTYGHGTLVRVTIPAQPQNQTQPDYT